MLSCTCGPLGIVGSSGAAPRDGGNSTYNQRAIVAQPLDRSSDLTALTLSPGIRRVWPVEGDPIQSSMPLATVLVKANCLPSGLQTGAPNFPSCGSVIATSSPPGRRFDGQRYGIVRHVHAVGVGVDADARQRQKRLRDLGDGRISHGLQKDRVVMLRANRNTRGRRRVQNVADVRGRLLVREIARPKQVCRMPEAGMRIDRS